MKKIKFLMVAFILFATAICAKAQMYDGITQPTKFRIWTPITISLDGKNTTTVAPFVGYKQQLGSHWSITGVAQYNINAQDFQIAAWVNYTPDQKFYILSRNIFDAKAKEFRETLSATYKLPLGFMIDATWENMFNGRKFCETDRLQFVGGWAYKHFVVNAGYSCRNAKGFIANVRYKVTDFNWIQLKYDGGTNSLCLSLALQWN